MMNRHNKIPIKNIFHMLSYAYNIIHLSEYKKIGTEKFSNVTDMYARILSLGIPVLIRGGLLKDYIIIEETSNVIKGKLDINASLKQNAFIQKKVAIKYDKLSENILLNQIIKATLTYLTQSLSMNREIRQKLYGFLPFFGNVSDIELNIRLWKKIRYDKQNIRYQFIIDICRYIYESLLLDDNTATDL